MYLFKFITTYIYTIYTLSVSIWVGIQLFVISQLWMDNLLVMNDQALKAMVIVTYTVIIQV